MKPDLLYLILSISPLISFAQAKPNQAKMEHMESKSSKENLSLVKNFIHDLANEENALDVILSQYVTVNDPSDEMYDYLEVSLQEIRINLMTKKLENIQYKTYSQLPRKEVRDIDPEDMDVNNMYFLYHKDRLVTSIYVEEGKIASFTLVSKGEEMAHFVTY
ncbi:hypothetical protein [Sphingobacterium sp. CZ-2]|uniref:hypothetical protein n=1 Tax=Sphingobacterium sp. CZ-2 TaxID=2557994 RepID=UPI0010703711|nr:hypothetical protein [Sphingobacterium sp. CZ-2]QBR12267.1 hypothetical protein E3D81_08875 [Sphingobacterium sp. CZ-2]